MTFTLCGPSSRSLFAGTRPLAVSTCLRAAGTGRPVRTMPTRRSGATDWLAGDGLPSGESPGATRRRAAAPAPRPGQPDEPGTAGYGAAASARLSPRADRAGRLAPGHLEARIRSSTKPADNQ